MAGTVGEWFRKTVLPIWKDHTIEMRPSPEELERHLHTNLQTTMDTWEHSSANSEEIMDLFRMSGAALLNTKYKLFSAVKIEYKAYNVTEDSSHDMILTTDVDKTVSDDYPAENPQPFFVGTARVTKLFRRLMRVSQILPLGSYLRGRETTLVSKNRLKHKISLRKKVFKNPLAKLDEGSNGYKLSDAYGTSCLCLCSSMRLVVMEEYQEDGGFDDNRIARGGLIFFFMNPLFSDKSIPLLYSIMRNRSGNTEPARKLMEKFLKIISVFLFPTFTISILVLDIFVENIEELGEYFKIFFHNDASGDFRILLVDDAIKKLGQWGTNTYLITSSGQFHKSFNLKVRLFKYHEDNLIGFGVEQLKMLNHHTSSSSSPVKEIEITTTAIEEEQLQNGEQTEGTTDGGTGEEHHHKIIKWYQQGIKDIHLFD